MKATFALPSTEIHKETVCPFCGESLAAAVAAHLAAEEEGIGEPTINMIRELYPSWTEDHGACSACWAYYRNLILVLNTSGCFDARFRIQRRETTLTGPIPLAPGVRSGFTPTTGRRFAEPATPVLPSYLSVAALN